MSDCNCAAGGVEVVGGFIWTKALPVCAVALILLWLIIKKKKTR